MRIPKFRIYNYILNRMLTDDEVRLGCFIRDGGLYPAANCVIMESTSLLDRLGKEVYDGDIILSGALAKLKNKWVMKWETGSTQPFCHYYDEPEYDWEVIGNIYEHSYLSQG